MMPLTNIPLVANAFRAAATPRACVEGLMIPRPLEGMLRETRAECFPATVEPGF